MERYEDIDTFITYKKWVKAPLQKEGGELLRVFGLIYERDYDQDKDKGLKETLIENYNSTTPKILNEAVWAKLDNTDSYNFNPGEFDKIGEVIGGKRDWQELKLAFENEEEMEIPIITTLPDGKNHLVSGNTRLSVARALNIRPLVIFIEFPI